MKVSRSSRIIAQNTLGRVREAYKKGKRYACLDSESLAAEVEAVAKRVGHALVCEHCERFLSFGDGKAHATSPSLHKINPTLGYVKGNLAVLCFECNTAIGESGDANNVRRKIAAMQWQLAKLGG